MTPVYIWFNSYSDNPPELIRWKLLPTICHPLATLHRTAPHHTTLSQVVTIEADCSVPAAFDGNHSLTWKRFRYSEVTVSAVVVCVLPLYLQLNVRASKR